jgi:hypothetical protein
MNKNAVDAYLELLKEIITPFRKSAFTKSAMSDPENKSKKIYTVLDVLGQLIENKDYKRILDICKSLERDGFYESAKSNFDILRIINDIDSVIERMEELSSIDSSDFDKLAKISSFFASDENTKMFIADFGGDDNTEMVIDMCSFIVVCLFFSAFSGGLLSKIYRTVSKYSYGINESDSNPVSSDGAMVDGKYVASFFLNLAGSSSAEDQESAVIVGENFEDVKKKFANFLIDSLISMYFDRGDEPQYYDEDMSDDENSWNAFSPSVFEKSRERFEKVVLDLIKNEKDLTGNIFPKLIGTPIGYYIPKHYLESEFFGEGYLGSDAIRGLVFYADNHDKHAGKIYNDFTVIGDPVFLGESFGKLAKKDPSILIGFSAFLNCLVITPESRTKVKEKYPEMAKAFEKNIGEEKSSKLDSLENARKKSGVINRLYEFS